MSDQGIAVRENNHVYPETQALRDLHTKLRTSAEYCRNSYNSDLTQRDAAKRRHALDHTRSILLTGIADLSKEVHQLAVDFADRLEKQSERVAEVTKDMHVVETKARIVLHRESLNQLKKLAKPKNTPKTPICYKGILYPGEKEVKRAPQRMPEITYKELDSIGHGVEISDQVLLRAVTELFVHGRRPSNTPEQRRGSDIPLEGHHTKSIIPRDHTLPRDNTTQRDSVTPRDYTKTRDSVPTPRDYTKTRESVTPRDNTKPRDSVTPRDNTKTRESVTPRDYTKRRDSVTAPRVSVTPTNDFRESCMRLINREETRPELQVVNREETRPEVQVEGSEEEGDEFEDQWEIDDIYTNDTAEEAPTTEIIKDGWIPETYLHKGTVLYAYESNSEEELTIHCGETIYVTWLEDGEGPWCQGVTKHGCGLLPLDYLYLNKVRSTRQSLIDKYNKNIDD